MGLRGDPGSLIGVNPHVKQPFRVVRGGVVRVQFRLPRPQAKPFGDHHQPFRFRSRVLQTYGILVAVAGTSLCSVTVLGPNWQAMGEAVDCAPAMRREDAAIVRQMRMSIGDRGTFLEETVRWESAFMYGPFHNNCNIGIAA